MNLEYLLKIEKLALSDPIINRLYILLRNGELTYQEFLEQAVITQTEQKQEITKVLNNYVFKLSTLIDQ